MLAAVIKGEADTAMTSVSTSINLVREGKLRALAVGSPQAMPQLPDVPPAAQTIPGLEFGIWHGIAAPAGMDPALANRINGVFNQVLQVPAVRATITGPWASTIIGGSPQQFDAFIKNELKRWPAVVAAAGIKPE
jgi:tripartite-type tricarboxylate transporter receptor subunit TctC